MYHASILGLFSCNHHTLVAFCKSCASNMAFTRMKVLTLLSVWAISTMAAVFSEADYASGAVHERIMGIKMVSNV